MSDAVKLYITSDANLNAKLRKCMGPALIAASRKALRQASKMVLDEARNTVPRKTGTFRSSLTVRAFTRNKKKGRIGFYVSQRNVPPRPTTKDRQTGFYGSFLELGYMPTGRPRKQGVMDEMITTYRGGELSIGQLRRAQAKKIKGQWKLREASIRKEYPATKYWEDELWRFVKEALG